MKQTSTDSAVDCKLPITLILTVSASFLNSASVRSWFCATMHQTPLTFSISLHLKGEPKNSHLGDLDLIPICRHLNHCWRFNQHAAMFLCSYVAPVLKKQFHLTGRHVQALRRWNAVSGTRQFDRSLSAVRHSEMHWLDIPEQIVYKLGVMTYGCQHGKAPQYLANCCTPVKVKVNADLYSPLS